MVESGVWPQIKIPATISFYHQMAAEGRGHPRPRGPAQRGESPRGAPCTWACLARLEYTSGLQKREKMAKQNTTQKGSPLIFVK